MSSLQPVTPKGTGHVRSILLAVCIPLLLILIAAQMQFWENAHPRSVPYAETSPDYRPALGAQIANTITAPVMESIYDKLANDAIHQYNMAVKSGDRIEVCIRAMAVAAAFSQAQDESHYLEWKRLQRYKCGR